MEVWAPGGLAFGGREAGVELARACPGSWARSLEAPPFPSGVVRPGELPVGLVFFGTWVESSVVSTSPSGRLRRGCEIGPIAVNVDCCSASAVFKLRRKPDYLFGQ